ncbi:MAG: type II toxin-antitoxin system RelE/ParE family toxin [Deltaproteobacteria bacterium]|nr:type II toxin-antitoxin system RelE/ParE family toxin [Deltaproteobacteria bacterium]
MKFYFHEDAETEFDRAIEYYEDSRSGLGLEFAQEVYVAIIRVIQFPDAWSPMSKNTRRCLVSRFPFGIIYQVKSDYVRIIAVADLRRRPNYWRDRV